MPNLNLNKNYTRKKRAEKHKKPENTSLIAIYDRNWDEIGGEKATRMF
jgi:hypothetical protein